VTSGGPDCAAVLHLHPAPGRGPEANGVRRSEAVSRRCGRKTAIPSSVRRDALDVGGACGTVPVHRPVARWRQAERTLHMTTQRTRAT
jgi:hypothetical protein